MTKRELIQILEESDAPDNTLIMLSSDEEGNSYRIANIDSYVSKAYGGGHEWEVLHPDDEDEYEPSELTDVLVFW